MDTKSMPTTPGVYLFSSKQGTILYVGKAINLKKRISSYFQKNPVSVKTAQLVSHIYSIKTIKTASEFDALLLEAKLIRQYQPKYNSISKDDKHPLYIAITNDEFPKIRTIRKSSAENMECFGPFSSTKIVKDTLDYLRKIFPFCTEKSLGKKPCFYHHLGLCNPCPNTIRSYSESRYRLEKIRYRKNIGHIRKILRGHSQKVLQHLKNRMHHYAQHEEFEKAQETKEQFEKLSYLQQRQHTVAEYVTNPQLYEDIRKQECEELARLLELPSLYRIEGYDISNTSGKEAVGSMTVVLNGDSAKDQYRKFKIRLKQSPDDFSMMAEMLERRLNHPEWPTPDLIMIDGGKGQVSRVIRVLEQNGISIPVIGLAKRLEEIIVPVKRTAKEPLNFKTIRIPLGSPALSLLQRLRDEAHRFGKNYHISLRTKQLFNGTN